MGFLFARMIATFFKPDPADVRDDGNFWALVFAGIGLTQGVGILLKHLCFGVVSEQLACRVRRRTFEKILQQSRSFFDKHGTGSLCTRLSTDCHAIKVLTGVRVGEMVQMLACLAVGLVGAFLASWELALIVFALIPLIAAGIAAQNAVVGAAADESADQLNLAGDVVSETVRDMRTVAAFGLQGNFVDVFGKLLLLPLEQSYRKGLATGLGIGFGQLIILGGAGLQYYIAGKLFRMGIVTFQDIMQVLLCIMFCAVGLGQIASSASDQAEAAVSARRIRALWLVEPNIDLDAGDVPSAPTKGEIVFASVSFAYPNRPDVSVLKGIDLTVASGSTVAFVGPSGCGKSTLVRLIERDYDVQGGAVRLDGVDIRSLNVQWLRKQIGLVQQEPSLFACSIGENIAYGLAGATTEQIEKAAAMAQCSEFVDKLPNRYDTLVGEKGLQLSGGQKQRVAIARALIRDPAILLLDEATSALDNASERQVQAALDTLLEQRQRTTVIIAHRLSTIRNADTLCVVSDGQVVETGSHDELIGRAAGTYAALVSAAGGS